MGQNRDQRDMGRNRNEEETGEPLQLDEKQQKNQKIGEPHQGGGQQQGGQHQGDQHQGGQQPNRPGQGRQDEKQQKPA